MTQLVMRFLSRMAICIVMLVTVTSGFAASNVTTGDIGDYGAWATEHNLEEFKGTLSNDLTQYRPKQMVADYVPIEARLGLMLMNALTTIAEVLDDSLVRFVIIFMLIGYAFWIMFEAYKMMTDGKGAIKALAENIVKKGGMIAIWIAVLSIGPAQVFMWIMGPIITIGTYMADLILNSVTSASGAQLPDTCAAIRDFAATHTSPNMLIDANGAADILCLPTRLSGFFLTAIAAGWEWMGAGIGTSAFTFLVGLAFVILFAIAMYRFALMALGVIADLFLGIMLLPFTAVSETLGKTSYKGIAGEIFNGFLGLFKVESLQSQITRYINAAIYFVSLSIVIGVCAALLSWTVDANLATMTPTIDSPDFTITFLTGCIVLYLAYKSDKIAKDLGGNIDAGIELGKKFEKDAVTLGKNTYGYYKKVRDIIRSGGESKK